METILFYELKVLQLLAIMAVKFMKFRVARKRVFFYLGDC